MIRIHWQGWLIAGLLAFSLSARADDSAVLVDRWGLEHEWNAARPLSIFGQEKPKAFVLAFLNAQCPLVNRIYAPILKDMDREFRGQQVQFLGIYSGPGTTRLEMAGHKLLQDFAFPVFLDEQSKLAKQYGAERLSQVVLLDAEGRTVYSGPIDDSAWEGSTRRKTEGVTPLLSNALTALLAGKKPEVAKFRPRGCEIQFPQAKVAKSDTDKVKFYPHVDRIIRERCANCHAPGEIGPNSFVTYRDAADLASTIARVVKYQRMPPYQTEGSYGRKLEHTPHMTAEERDLVVAWVEDGALEGDRKLAEARPQATTKPGQFSIGGGKPDLVITMQKPFVVPAHKELDYQFFWIPTDMQEGRWIKEVEVIPGDPRVVHHAQVHLKERSARASYLPKLPNGQYDFSKPLSGAFIMSDFYGFSGETARRVASFLPGNQYNVRKLPSEQGIYVPAGMDLVFELHYTPCGQDAPDRSKVGFVWGDKAPAQALRNDVFFKPKGFLVPANDPHYEAKDEFYFKQNVQLLDVRPHLHLRGADFRIVLERPDGTEELLVAVPAYDFNWQHTYVFAEPVIVPAGSSLKTIAHWDNSRLNPNNPDSTKDVSWGQQSGQEMDNVVVTYVIDEAAEKASKLDKSAKAGR